MRISPLPDTARLPAKTTLTYTRGHVCTHAVTCSHGVTCSHTRVEKKNTDEKVCATLRFSGSSVVRRRRAPHTDRPGLATKIDSRVA